MAEARSRPEAADDGALSAPPPPWESHRRANRSARPRRVPLNLDRIVEAAFAVLDREGLEALTMRKVAAELKFTVSALYVHIQGREELLQVLHERIYEHVQIPDAHPDPQVWRVQLKQIAADLLASLEAHRDMARVSMGRLPTGPAMIDQMERLLTFFLDGGLPPDAALRASDMLSLIVEGIALDHEMWARHAAAGPGDAADSGETNGSTGNGTPGNGTDADGAGQGWSPADYFASLPPHRFPNLSAHADKLMNDQPEQRFEAMMEIFVNGLLATRPEVGRQNR